VRFYFKFISNYRSREYCARQLNRVNLAFFIIYLRRGRRLKENSISSLLSALGSYSKFLVKIGQLESNSVPEMRRALKSARPLLDNEMDHLVLTRHLRSEKLSLPAARNLLIVELVHHTGLTAAEISTLYIKDVIWRRGGPAGIAVKKGRRPRLILLREKHLQQIVHLYTVMRRLQAGSRLIKGRSGEERGCCPGTITRAVKTARQRAGLTPGPASAKLARNARSLEKHGLQQRFQSEYAA